MSEWQPIETAPRDGTPVQAKIPGNGSDNIIAWMQGFADEKNDECGAWCFMSEQEPPDNWTDGVCWDLNEDGEPSTQPIEWRPPPPEDVG